MTRIPSPVFMREPRDPRMQQVSANPSDQRPHSPAISIPINAAVCTPALMAIKKK
jgi:hypothetical protein